MPLPWPLSLTLHHRGGLLLRGFLMDLVQSRRPLLLPPGLPVVHAERQYFFERKPDARVEGLVLWVGRE